MSFLSVVKLHVRAKYHQAEYSNARVIVLTKKNSDENNTARRYRADTNKYVSHRRRLQGNGGECPRRITPHRAPPPDEEFDLRHEFAHLFSGKSTKTAATRAALFDSSMHQTVCRLGLRPRPTGRAHSDSQTP